MLKVGEKVKIMKGTHKGKWGYIFILKDSFIQVKTQDYIKSKAQGDSEDIIVEKIVRAKREFVKPVPGLVLEMPEAHQVQTVCELPEEAGLSQEDQELCQEILDTMPLPENDDDILSQHDEETVDISGGVIGQQEMPHIQTTEEKCDEFGNRIHELEDQLVKSGYELSELRESVDMFMKCAEFIKGRLDSMPLV